jgi:hypothetical protein
MSFTGRTLVPLIAASLFLACSEQADHPTEPANARPALSQKPGEPGDAADRQFYQVRLGAEPGSRSNGVMLIEIVGGHIAVRVHAAGLMPNANIPQHIHLNPTCSPGGGILLNLDANLTVAGEGPGVGSAYPLSNQAGVINYSASRSLTDLLSAVNTYRGETLSSVDELLDWLNLEERNGHMHVAVGPPFPAVNCGEVERLN